MKDKFYATCYRGYSKVVGQIELHTFFEQLAGKNFRAKIWEIEQAIKEGNEHRANNIKRQLPYFTLTANYSECRQAHSLVAYNDLLVLDFDEMTARDIPKLRTLAQNDNATIGCALSPRRHGLKLLVRLATPQAQWLREELEAKRTVTYAELEHYHKRMFELAARHYEQLLNSKVDASGSDLSRGMYATYDPNTFFSAERLEQLPPLHINLQLPTADECKRKKDKRQTEVKDRTEKEKAGAKTSRKADAGMTADIDPLSQLEFRKAVDYTRRKFRFEPNSRDSFVYCLGTQCYARHIDEEDALRLVLHNFGHEPDFDAETPLRNAYRYTNRIDEQAAEEKKPLMQRVIEFLNRNYEFRRNTILDRVEFRPLADGDTPAPFASMRGKDINTIYTQLHISSIYCSLNMLKAVIDSNFAKEFNPFTDYFGSLPEWDGTTDYIGQLAATVETEDPTFWKDSLQRWLVGMVACALDDEKQNHEMLVLYSRQGKGKSSFIRNLLPDTLSPYYRNGAINPDNKDHMLMLSTCLLINLEEFDGTSTYRLSDLKRIIVQDKITERKVYDTQAHTFIRHASFIASTNNPRCLEDIGENRRFLLNSVISIDYHRPVNHAGIYSQALALYRRGFWFWYEGDEIIRLNQRNEAFRLKEPVEENLFYYFRAARKRDATIAKWFSASSILTQLSIQGRIQSNRQTLQILSAVLKENGFIRRITKDGITEYWVVEYTVEERNSNAVRPQLPEQKKLDYPE